MTHSSVARIGSQGAPDRRNVDSAPSSGGKDILHPLNQAQRDAVSAPRDNILVLAGAGSGKTRVLVHRIAWLITHEKVSPQRLLAATFTNKAANEMRDRVEALLGFSTQRLWIGTFHSLALRLLHLHHEEAGLPRNFQILDADDQIRLVRRVTRELDIDDHRWPVKQSSQFINRCKDEGQRARHIQSDGDMYSKTQVGIYAAYEKKCQDAGLVDFAELLLRAHEIWLENDHLLASYQEKFQDLLVDEFQDTNVIQYAWLRVLAGEKGKVMAVGDDDQSIYGWRGARVDNIFKFEKDYPDAKIMRLEQNYRSTGTILKAANAVIAHNIGRMGKKLWTQAEEGAPIEMYAASDEADEADFIATRIRTWEREGKPLSDIGILYRSNAQSQIIEDALMRAKIPYRIHGGFHFYERVEIRDALAYMQMLLNPHLDMAFERIFNTPSRGVGKASLQRIQEFAQQQGVSLWQASKLLLANNEPSGRGRSGLQRLVNLIEDLQQRVRTMDLAQMAAEAINLSGLVEHHGKGKTEQAQSRVDNLKELVSACARYQDSPELFANVNDERPEVERLLDSFLSQAAVGSWNAQKTGSDLHDSVQVMTLHAAKGLEFQFVFIAGMENGLFPRNSSFGDRSRLEEERRLFYVGLTRAMKAIYITYAEARKIHGRGVYNAPSSFLKEIPTDLFKEIRRGYCANLEESANTDAAPPDLQVLHMGQRVLHPTFGEGWIRDAEGSGERAKARVEFISGGSKWLVLRYAKLQALG